MPVPANAGPAIAAAMELVAGTYALIIDMRRNGGGSPDGVVFWCSYLLDERPTHLTDIVHAGTGDTRQFWTLPYVPGSRLRKGAGACAGPGRHAAADHGRGPRHAGPVASPGYGYRRRSHTATNHRKRTVTGRQPDPG